MAALDPLAMVNSIKPKTLLCVDQHARVESSRVRRCILASED